MSDENFSDLICVLRVSKSASVSAIYADFNIRREGPFTIFGLHKLRQTRGKLGMERIISVWMVQFYWRMELNTAV